MIAYDGGKLYAKFQPFFARYWAADSSTLYPVRDFSLSRKSAYVINGPRVELVPVDILEFVSVG